MKKFTKLLTTAAAAALGLTVGACGNGGGTTSADAEQIVLSYANWNLGTAEENNIERRMIAAFEEAHPHITIEIDESIPGGNWMENLSIAASAGNLPHVFMLSDAPTSMANGWLMDISEITNANAEFNNLPTAMQEATKLNGAVYSVPFAQFMMGFYVNRDLFNDLNLDAPQQGFSMEEFKEAVRNTTDLNRPSIGVNNVESFVSWYAGAVNPNMGFFTFEDGTYNLNSDEMIEGIRVARELGQNGFAFAGLSEEQREAVFATTEAPDAFRNGQVAMLFEGSWMNGDFSETLPFEWDFIGIPGGRSVLTLDILGIAQTAEHPEEALLFAQWMGHGNDGFLKRMEMAQEMGIQVSSLPISTNEDVLAAYWEKVNVPGIITAYENLDNAMIEGNKIVPGFVASRWEATTGLSIPGTDIDNATIGQIFEQSIFGTLNFADYATQVNELAQQQHDQAVAAMN